jgi:hypothetical protein
MPDYSKGSTFNKDANFQAIKFGADAPLLETELNELQDILSSKSEQLGKLLLSDGFKIKSQMSLANGLLTVPSDAIIAGGKVFPFDSPMTISVSNGNIIYLAITTVEITKDSTIYKNGNISSAQSITNNLVDSRIGSETSRRLQTQLSLVKSTGTSGVTYLPVATITGATTLIDNRVKSSIIVPNLIDGGDFGDLSTGTLYDGGDF